MLEKEQFDHLYQAITCDVQEAIRAHIGVVADAQSARATSAALGTIFALFVTQQPDLREVFDKALGMMSEKLLADPVFRAGSEAVRAGNRNVTDQMSLDGSDIAAASQEPEHGPDTCLACAIRDAILKFHGGPITDAGKAREAIEAIARVAAVMALDAGPTGTIAFATHFNAFMIAISEARSTDGMTKQ